MKAHTHTHTLSLRSVILLLFNTLTHAQVTNAVQYLPSADQILVLDGGKVAIQVRHWVAVLVTGVCARVQLQLQLQLLARPCLLSAVRAALL